MLPYISHTFPDSRTYIYLKSASRGSNWDSYSNVCNVMFQCVVELLRVLYLFPINSHCYFKGSESGFLKDQSRVNHWYSPYQRSICEAGAICWFIALVSFKSLLNKKSWFCILLLAGNIITFVNHLARLLVHKLPGSHFKIYYFNVQMLFGALASPIGRKHCLLVGPDCMNFQYPSFPK